MVRLGDHLSVLPHYPGGVYAASRAWAKSHREVLIAFLRAWLASIRWVKDPANRDEAIKLVAADLKLSPKAATESLDELSSSGALNVPGLESVLDLRIQIGLTPKMGSSISSYYDLDYYQAALGK
jgi:ABC-type nitrate/sulfonate/bicarbonate transport system substrate-binding protein